MKLGLRPHHHRYVSALIGGLLGLGAPLGWLFLQSILSHPGWLTNEIVVNAAYYTYLTVGTVIVFAAFGFFLGRREDVTVNEADSVKAELVKVHGMAFTDALTGIFNARHLHTELSNQVELSRRYRTPLSCVMVDIDGFKGINDSFGHPFGDYVLITLGKAISRCLRKVDIVGRLGGEEFLVIMPHTAAENAYVIADRVRVAVEHTEFSKEGFTVPVTVSVGVASFPTENIGDKGALLKAADEALYEAKRTGKNRTVLFRANARQPQGL